MDCYVRTKINIPENIPDSNEAIFLKKKDKYEATEVGNSRGEC